MYLPPFLTVTQVEVEGTVVDLPPFLTVTQVEVEETVVLTPFPYCNSG